MRTGRYKTSRLFSVQLAGHDAYFAPVVKPPRSFVWLKLSAFAVAIACLCVIPNFQIGCAENRDPGFTLPKTLTAGEVFTLPVDEDEEVFPQIFGRRLPVISGKNPMYLAAALRAPELPINIDFEDDGPKLKKLLPRLKHPKYPLFFQRVPVTAAAASTIPEPALTTAELQAMGSRTDGQIRLRCWKEPNVEALGEDPLKPRRRTHLGALQAAGSGEIIYSGAEPGGTISLLIHHGGGLYTRYWGLKESRVSKNTKVSIGQTIGYVPLVPRERGGEHLTPATWRPYLAGFGRPTGLTAQSLLALSSRLCDSK